MTPSKKVITVSSNKRHLRKMMAIKIEKKIVGYSVLSEEDKVNQKV